MSKAYFISGLAAGKKAFQYTRLPDDIEPVFLDWLPPLKNESLQAYAKRFSELIKEPRFILIGLSFGGMLASEIAKIKQPEKLILISSISRSTELPWYYRTAGKLRLHRIIPVNLMKTVSILKRLVSDETGEVKAVLRDYARHADAGLIRWSLQAIVNWRHTERIPGIIHIHGDRDRLLPVKYTNPDYIIRGGDHLMVLNKADEVNRILEKALHTLSVTEAVPG